ncbi:Calpain-7 [Strongyloides ratti]|uniref:Calpain-7 n=1 Tax=Strongyloides ratti TaxID=34506 RepID=A0A090L2H9_STRRB|nr:Calpain-7 [Strongyloides ratti]CEF63902.1 Calpain-7 [Strongyloides ratti]
MSSLRNCVARAIALDESGDYEKAIQTYIECIDIIMNEMKKENNSKKKEEMRLKIERFIKRAEYLKLEIKKNTISDDMFPSVPTDDLTISKLDPSENINEMIKRPSSNDLLSKDEKKVLMETSLINGIKYVPFMDIDLKEKFFGNGKFKDPDGLLKLSGKQKEQLKCWKRIDEISSKPVIIDKIDCKSVKQTVVSDCSFVASLSITSEYENKFKKQLISKILYPQKNGYPVYNPFGKYMVQLYVNGIKRKVIIDDLLPVGENGKILCSLSKNPNEFWISLIEKAYMKVMGGYNFPGSSSNIDMYALTGWIPERSPLKSADPDNHIDNDLIFNKLLSRYHQGHCLITVSTGQLSKEEQDRTGLVELHAYAVLDLRDIDGLKLLKLKNPWTHFEWKGNYSDTDTLNWTPKLMKLLNYDPKYTQNNDDGIFWIDYKSLIHFFDVFYINWDPKIFPFSEVVHDSWDAGSGPVKDLYSVSQNPQYTLDVYPDHETTSVWILLSRHITEISDFENNKEYITVIVYESGNKIYLPFDIKPIHNGSRINSPHYLGQLLIKGKGIKKYTLVVAQYEKSKTILYSLRVFSTAKIKLKKIITQHKFTEKLSGIWSDNESENKSMFMIVLDDSSDKNDLVFEIKAPKQYHVCLYLYLVSLKRPTHNSFETKSCDKYRNGYNVLELKDVPSGTFKIEVKTHIEKQYGPFFLSIQSSCRFKVKPA